MLQVCQGQFLEKLTQFDTEQNMGQMWVSLLNIYLCATQHEKQTFAPQLIRPDTSADQLVPSNLAAAWRLISALIGHDSAGWATLGQLEHQEICRSGLSSIGRRNLWITTSETTIIRTADLLSGGHETCLRHRRAVVMVRH